jgi:shikimate dehydrogenase
MTRSLKLGLIGDNIAQSQAWRLHRIAGAQNGISVTYDRLIPKERGLAFDALFDWCAANAYRGLNITYPYKEKAAPRVTIDDPLVRAIGAVNTIIFENGAARGYNTDYSGFIAAYRRVRGASPPGDVLMIGAGGVGKAIAFGLIALGVAALRIVDRDADRAEALADAVRAAAPGVPVCVGTDAAGLAAGASGLVNCSPVGMVGYDGTPLPPAAMRGAAWAFDAVYTPVDTQFLGDAAAEGLTIISGYELFIGQGVDAWTIFSGAPLDDERLRADLLAGVTP